MQTLAWRPLPSCKLSRLASAAVAFASISFLAAALSRPRGAEPCRASLATGPPPPRSRLAFHFVLLAPAWDPLGGWEAQTRIRKQQLEGNATEPQPALGIKMQRISIPAVLPVVPLLVTSPSAAEQQSHTNPLVQSHFPEGF